LNQIKRYSQAIGERYAFADRISYVVDDDVVIDVVKKQIQDCEAKGKSWVV
jgi:hypothetical protein